MNCKIIIFSVTWILAILLLKFSCFLRRRKPRTALCITEAALLCCLAECLWCCISEETSYAVILLETISVSDGWRSLLFQFNKCIHIYTNEINRTLYWISFNPPQWHDFPTQVGADPSRPQYVSVNVCVCKCVHVNSTLYNIFLIS